MSIAVQFNAVKDDIKVLRKAHMSSTPFLSAQYPQCCLWIIETVTNSSTVGLIDNGPIFSCQGRSSTSTFFQFYLPEVQLSTSRHGCITLTQCDCDFVNQVFTWYFANVPKHSKPTWWSESGLILEIIQNEGFLSAINQNEV